MSANDPIRYNLYARLQVRHQPKRGTNEKLLPVPASNRYTVLQAGSDGREVKDDRNGISQ
jgi:hypothetical protein